MLFPGEMLNPGRSPRKTTAGLAPRLLAEAGAENGLFFVVFAEEKEVLGGGFGIGTVRG
jgi:hypothetical protein